MAKKVYIGVNSRKVTLTNLFPTTDVANFAVAQGVAGTSTPSLKYSQAVLSITSTTSLVERSATSKNKYTLNSSHKYYARVEVYQKSVVGSTALYWPIGEPPFFSAKVAKANQWTVASAVNTRSTFTSGDYEFRIDFDNNKVAGTTYYDGLMLIDLTACFGAGNEPDVAWCDANIPYFADTITIEQAISSGVAHKVKKIYVGVDGVARRVKKAYIGVEGVARCFWSGSDIQVTKIGTGTGSDYSKYAVLEGGSMAIGDSYIGVRSSVADANGYDTTLKYRFFDKSGTYIGQSSSIDDNADGYPGCCESVGNYGIYMYKQNVAYVYAIDASLTRTTVTTPEAGSYRVWARLPNYAISVYNKAVAINSSLTATSLSTRTPQIDRFGASGCGTSYVIAYNAYNSFISYNNSLTYSLVTNGSPFDSNQLERNIAMVPHINGTIVIPSGHDTDDGEEYEGDDIKFVNTSLTTTQLMTKGTYESPSCVMRLAGQSICCGHDAVGNVDKWTWVWDESLIRTQPAYVTASSCAGTSSISEDWGAIIGGVRYVDGADYYCYLGMNILTT